MAREIYLENLRLSELEYRLQHIHLQSRPRYLGLVLSNKCNIGCIHCYQPKNNDDLLQPESIGKELRREFIGLYPYLSTLRMQGGELFILPGFSQILDDIAAVTDRPIVSISTNATRIDDAWAERIVRTPFQNVTISIDAGTPETFARLRRGGNFQEVIRNTRRIQCWKEKLDSPFPHLDSFFVVMRSNFREIPRFLEIAHECGITSVCFQTVEINPENSARFPMLEKDELISSRAETVELHGILGEVVSGNRAHFQFRFSGLTDLFNQHELDSSILNERQDGLYPDSDDLKASASDTPTFELCPNPWTTLFVVENGDVHLCFLAKPVGNLYEMPLSDIWNSPAALAKRSRMIAGRYQDAGCSRQWCSWREGSRQELPQSSERESMLVELRHLATQATAVPSETADTPELKAVRRMLTSRNRRISELEAMFQQLCGTNQELHEQGQAHIANLETRLRETDRKLTEQDTEFSRLWGENQATHRKAQSYIDELEQRLAESQQQLRRFEHSPVTRITRRLQMWSTHPRKHA